MAMVGEDYYFFIKENSCSIKKHALHFDLRVMATQKFLSRAAASSAHFYVRVSRISIFILFYLGKALSQMKHLMLGCREDKSVLTGGEARVCFGCVVSRCWL